MYRLTPACRHAIIATKGLNGGIPVNMDADARKRAMRGLEEYISYLEATLEQTRQELAVAHRGLAHLNSGLAAGTCGGEETPLPYAGMQPQAAVERFLIEHPAQRFKASVVAKGLREAGLQREGGFASQVAGALMRAIRKGIALRVHVNGAWHYFAKNEEPESQ